MSKIDLTSEAWCELVFEGKNKEYGAYDMRLNSTRRHYIALIVVLVLSLILFFLPTLISIVTPKNDKLVVTEVTALSDLKEADDDKKEIEQPRVEELPEPPVKSSIKFTAPVITTAEVPIEEQMKTNEDLTKSDLTISKADIKGNDDDNPDAKTIGELDQIAQSPVEDKPYLSVEQMPQFPGGETAMRNYIAKNLRYPTIAQENGIQGKVYVRFVITKTGEVSNVEVTRGIDSSCDKEAIRVILSMPKWIPGKQNGNAVSVIYTVPVVFKLI